MKEPPSRHDDWKQNAAELRAGWRPLVFFDLLIRLLTLAVFAPLSALFLGGILRWSGDAAVSNFDLIAFFLSPQGILLILFSATLGFALLFFELGGLAMIVIAIREGKRPSALRTVYLLGKNFRLLCILGLRQFVVLGGVAVALLAVFAVTKKTVVGGGDIYFYLQTKPPAYWTALSIVGTAGLIAGIAAIILLIRWIFSVPLLLTGDLKPGQAMAESSRLVRAAGARAVIAKVLIWAAGSFVIIAASGAVQWTLEQTLTAVAGDRISWVIASAALLQAVALVLGNIIGFVMAVTFAAAIVRLFTAIRPETKAPDSLTSDVSDLSREKRMRLRWLIFGGATALIVLAIGFSWALIERIQIVGEVAVTAHRGSSLAAPENSRAAILRAIEDRSDYVEIDVQETADGIVVLIHDTDLRRLAGVDRNTWEVPLVEMKQLDFGSWFSPEFSAERIVTLEECIELVRGKARLNIELKFNGHDEQLEAAVAKIVEENDFEKDSILMSLEYRGMQKIALLNDQLPTGLTLTAGLGDPTRFDVDFLAVNANSVTRDLVNRAHRAGMEIHVWTVNEPVQMLTMIHLGVDNIITDAPDLLVELQEERAELSNAEKTLLYLADFLAGRL